MLLHVALLLTLAEPGFGGGEAAPEEAGFGGTAAEREKAAMRQRLAEDRVRTQFLKREEASLLGGLSELEARIAKERAKGLEILTRKQRLALELVRREAESAEASARREELRRSVGRRAAAMARLKRTELAALLARTKSPAEARKLADRLGRVLAVDLELVKDARAADERAREALDAFLSEKAALDAAELELEAQREALLEARADRSALLESIGKERGAIERVAKEIARAATRLESELDVVHGREPAPEAVEGGFAAQKGRLPWPAAGKVEVPFGMRVDPETGVVMTHKGIDLRARLMEPIRAVFRGRVAFEGTLEGYGRTVVIDHGAGYFTVYAHLESSAVAASAEVDAGQVLGHVGDSGSLKGAYLYFEIRQSKTALDPFEWLAR